MGTGSNLHDGSSLICKTVNKLTQNGSKPGRVVVMSAGNLADNKQSVLAKLGTADTDGWQLKTVLGSDVIMSEPDDLPFYKMLDVFAYADDGKDFTMELKAVNIETGEVTDAESQILASPISGVKYIPQVVKGERINIKDEKVVINEIVATDAFFLKDQKFRLALFVKGTAGQTIKLFRGNNNVAEWCFYAPDKLTGYTDGSSDFTFNADACTDAVISVGAYTTATEWQDYYDMTKGYRPSKITGKEQVLGEIADFSSYGVDDNGKNRPTVIAPGQGLLSAINLYDETSFDATGEPKTGEDSNTAHICPRSMMIEKGGRKNWYGHKEGTSMSSPHVAGIIALWLEANPNLSALQIADIIKETSVKDEFCTDISKIPGHNLVQAGAGKIDAVAGMKKVLELTGIRTVDADKRQDADAPVYNLMGQKVERSHRGIVISNGRKYVKK
jgi:subtilisin family serine protease